MKGPDQRLLNCSAVAASGWRGHLGVFEYVRSIVKSTVVVHGQRSRDPFRISFTYTAFTLTPNAIWQGAISEKRVVT